MIDYPNVSDSEVNQRIADALKEIIGDCCTREDDWLAAVGKLSIDQRMSLYSALTLRATSIYEEELAHTKLPAKHLWETPLAFSVVYLMLLPTRVKAEALLAVLEAEPAQD